MNSKSLDKIGLQDNHVVILDWDTAKTQIEFFENFIKGLKQVTVLAAAYNTAQKGFAPFDTTQVSSLTILSVFNSSLDIVLPETLLTAQTRSQVLVAVGRIKKQIALYKADYISSLEEEKDTQNVSSFLVGAIEKVLKSSSFKKDVEITLVSGRSPAAVTQAVTKALGHGGWLPQLKPIKLFTTKECSAKDQNVGGGASLSNFIETEIVGSLVDVDCLLKRWLIRETSDCGDVCLTIPSARGDQRVLCDISYRSLPSETAVNLLNSQRERTGPRELKATSTVSYLGLCHSLLRGNLFVLSPTRSYSENWTSGKDSAQRFHSIYSELKDNNLVLLCSDSHSLYAVWTGVQNVLFFQEVTTSELLLPLPVIANRGEVKKEMKDAIKSLTQRQVYNPLEEVTGLFSRLETGISNQKSGK